MVETVRKISGVFAVFGLILAIAAGRSGIAGMRDRVDLYEEGTSISDIGYFDFVSADIFCVYGSYATKTTTENNVKTGEKSYYVIPAMEGEELRLIGIEVDQKEYSKFNQIYEDTYDELNEETNYGVRKTGFLKKMGKEMKEYYYSELWDSEWFETKEEMEKVALPLYLSPVANPGEGTKVMFVGLIAFLVAGIVFVLSWLGERDKYEKSVDQTYVTIAGVKYLKSDLAHVNQCIQGQERIFAAQELAKITGLSLDEAGKVVENWRQYYY